MNSKSIFFWFHWLIVIDVSLQIRVPNYTITKIFPSVEAVAGYGVKLKCYDEEVSACEYKWTHDGKPVTTSDRFTIFENADLEIKNIEFYDAGEYTCLTTYRKSSTSAKTKLIVLVSSTVQNFEADPVDAFTMRLIFEKPNEIHGDLYGYHISFHPDHSDDLDTSLQTRRIQVNDVRQIMVKLSNLKMFTGYKFYIKAITSSGQGKEISLYQATGIKDLNSLKNFKIPAPEYRFFTKDDHNCHSDLRPALCDYWGIYGECWNYHSLCDDNSADFLRFKLLGRQCSDQDVMIGRSDILVPALALNTSFEFIAQYKPKLEPKMETKTDEYSIYKGYRIDVVYDFLTDYKFIAFVIIMILFLTCFALTTSEYNQALEAYRHSSELRSRCQSRQNRDIPMVSIVPTAPTAPDTSSTDELAKRSSRIRSTKLTSTHIPSTSTKPLYPTISTPPVTLTSSINRTSSTSCTASSTASSPEHTGSSHHSQQ